ncbi:MAG: hypothetical protein RBT46_01820 [Weeksellaceae bacterium]|nr:hypothetical protein [Weeksellaceae bacterium]
MNKKRKIHFPTVVMLLFYLLSILPNLLIHYHEHEIIAFLEADSCEKAIYYGVPDEHKEHLSKVQEECKFCDHHTPTPQLVFSTEFKLTITKQPTNYFPWYKSFLSVEPTTNYNKGPPFI